MTTQKDYRKRREHTYPAWVLTFLYIGMPMLFIQPKEAKTPPAVQAVIAAEERFGTGGIDPPPAPAEYAIQITPTPEDSVLTNVLSGGPFKVSGGPEPVIERVNYFNYSGARMPVNNPLVSSDFGWRKPPCKGCSANHQGVDFVPGAGENIYAVLDGMVLEAGYISGFGYWVKLGHMVLGPSGELENWETVYAHMQKDSIPETVKIGTVVKKGEIIGKVGNTGVSTGPHLHFEIRIEGKAVEPLPMIAQTQIIQAKFEEESTRKVFEITYQ